jgi:hypothetical protein
VLDVEDGDGFPGGGKGDPPIGAASGSRPAPRIIEAICSILRNVSGLDLLENQHSKTCEVGDADII